MSGSGSGTPASGVTELISLQEAQDHLRVDTYGSPEIAEDADVILAKLADAREYCELFTGLAMAPQTVVHVVDSAEGFGVQTADVGVFPKKIELPLSPAVAITSIVWVDADGEETTIDSDAYWLDINRKPSVVRAIGGAWAVTTGQLVITYTAGFDATTLPKSARTAILLMLSHLYDNRSNSAPIKIEEIPEGAKCFLRPLRVRLGMA